MDLDSADLRCDCSAPTLITSRLAAKTGMDAAASEWIEPYDGAGGDGVMLMRRES